MNNKAVFFDKDGTLIENVPYNVDVRQIRLAEGAIEGLRRLKQAGYKVIIVTNQSGVAFGYFCQKNVERVEAYLRQLLKEAGIELDGFYYCPHHPDGMIAPYDVKCNCRKPEPGLIVKAADEHDLNLTESWLIGDILNDIEAGNRAQCQTILLDGNDEVEESQLPVRKPHYAARNLAEAIEIILTEDNGEQVDIPLPKEKEEVERLPLKR